MTGELEPAPSPFGRYLTPRKQRLWQLVTPITTMALLLVLTNTDGEDTPAWFNAIFIALYVLAILGAISQWFIPLTIIDAQGIRRRRPNLTQKIAWADVFDAKFTSSWGTKYVLLLLWSGKQVRLYGVTEDAVEGIRRIAAENPAHPAHRQPFGPMTSHLRPAK
jgi:hypothetical protein